MRKNGPVLLDVLTYRYSGHSPSDASSTHEGGSGSLGKTGLIASFGKQLLEAGVAVQDELDAIWNDIRTLIHEMFSNRSTMRSRPA